MADQLDLDRALGLCFSRVRFISPLLKDKLRWEDVWEDLRQEMRLAAWEAVELGLGEQETRRLAGQHLYAFLKANGWRRRNGYWKMERPLSLNRTIGDTDDIELQDTVAAPEEDWDGALDARALLANCPPGIKRIARKLENDDPLTPNQEDYLQRFRNRGKPTPQQVWCQKHYKECKERGLCVVCGQRVDDGFVRCASCREKHRAYQALYRGRKGLAWKIKLREHWRKQGRCPRCGRLAESGRKKCPQCLAKDREGLRRFRERSRRIKELSAILQRYDREIVIAALKQFPGTIPGYGLAAAGR